MFGSLILKNRVRKKKRKKKEEGYHVFRVNGKHNTLLHLVTNGRGHERT
jgi:hypothetical protein